ncbi:MAG: Ldh family oxidoreductase [Gammaproteobacteria bacterium]|nr:Ldh family oxidoreductase [Gammaproteobacteria bacterium]
MAEQTLPLQTLHELIRRILIHHDTSPDNAECVARALVAAEADGQKGHGASRVPAYAAQARSRKVDGDAVPVLSELSASAALVDARDGFAFPAIEMAQAALLRGLSRNPVAAVAIRNSHHSGVAAHHVEAIARAGYIGISMSNTPQAIAPWGGTRGLFGTNPLAFAAPREQHPPLVIDMSLSKVARGRISVAAQAGEPIPPDWAFDAEGRPTADPQAAMDGTMAPMGDAKGAQLVLMVEILAAALSASSFGFEASSYFTAEGDPPRAGQLLIGLDPAPFSSGAFGARLETLLAAILAQPGTRLPGDRRLALRARAELDGVSLPETLYQTLQSLAA